MKRIFNHRGLSSVSEYMITFFAVTTVVVVMTVYIQRSLNGRMRDARHYMIQTMSAQCGENCMKATNMQGYKSFREEYEPYYVRTTSNVATEAVSHSGLLAPGIGGPGIFTSRAKSNVLVNTDNDQLPPVAALNEKLYDASKK